MLHRVCDSDVLLSDGMKRGEECVTLGKSKLWRFIKAYWGTTKIRTFGAARNPYRGLDTSRERFAEASATQPNASIWDSGISQ